MDGRKVRSGDKSHSKSKSSSKEKAKSSSKEKSKSKTNSNETRDKALDVMLNHALTKDDRYESLIKGLHQLSTVDKTLNKTIQRAKDTEDAYKKRTSHVKDLNKKYKEFMKMVNERRKRDGMPAKDFLKEDDIDAEFVQQVQKLKPIPGYLLYASSVVDQVRNDLGTTNRELLLNIHRLFPEIATRWSALSPSEKTTWREEPKQRLEDFKKYVQDVFEKRKK